MGYMPNARKLGYAVAMIFVMGLCAGLGIGALVWG